MPGGRLRRTLRALAPALLVLGAPLPCHAEELPPTRLEYRVPAHCPGVDVFSERVRRRSSRIHLVTEGKGLRTLVVEVIEKKGTLESSVRIVEVDGTERARHLKAKDCSEAIDGLALIATVSLDPEAILNPEPEPEPEPEPKAPEPSPAPQPAPTKPTPDEPERPAPRARSSSKSPVGFGAGLEASVLGELVPQWIAGGSAFVWIEYRTGTWVSPLLRGTFTYIPSKIERSEPHGVARFETTFAGAVDACAFRVGTRALNAWLPCVSAVGGRLTAEGDSTEEPEHHSRWFAAVGPSALVMLRLWEPVEIVADVRAGAALVRDRFRFAPNEEFYKIPPVTFSGGLGLAVGFP